MSTSTTAPAKDPACAPSDRTTAAAGPASNLGEMFQRELEAIGVQPEQAREAVQRGGAEVDPRDGGRGDGQAGSSPVYWLRHPPCDLFGLALSGGGIRSATFNLGLLQGLAKLELLRHFHYLSTVSGGGYIGGFWSAWRRQHGSRDGAFPASDPSGAESPHVRHLREFSNFLSPRMGLFNMETGNIVSVLFGSLVPSLLAALSLVVLVLYGWSLLAWGLFARSPQVSVALLVAVALGLQLIFERAWRKCSEAEDRAGGTYAACLLLALAVAGIFWYALRLRPGAFRWAWDPAPLFWGSPFLRPLQVLSGLSDLIRRFDFSTFLALFGFRLGGRLFAPAGALMGAALALIVCRWVASRWFTDFGRRCHRGAIDRALSRALLAAAAWLVIAALWDVGAVLIARYEGWGSVSVFGLSLASGGLFSWVRKILGEQPSKPLVGGFRERIKPLLPQVLAYLTLALLVVGCAALIVYFTSRWDESLWVRLSPLWVALVATALTLAFFDPNEVGLHAFYRARLARAYLGASNPRWVDQGNRVAADCEKDDLLLRDLPWDRPFHLVCCTANDLAGDHLANLHRGARSAVLSRTGFSVGEDWTRWDGGPEVSLASAMTASGAAFNSHMGSKSMAWGPAVTFLMTALNLRLGLWLPHPRRWTERVSRFLPGVRFYDELLSWSKAGSEGTSAAPGDRSPISFCARGKSVHLSDGGHFENMAIYELIRRHCRYILVSDCGADPDVAFDDLGNAVRRVREDFGVEIQIDLRPLRPGPDGLASQPMVSGDIFYPDGDVGVLLLFKPTLVGNEPADILQYKRRNAAFPHETTGDQFYDEAQWESYRRLGLHAAGSAFQSLQDGCACGAEVFARARFEWWPVPEAARESFPRLAERVSDLEALLRDDRCSRLLREVYKEIDELDRQAKLPAPEADGKGRTARERASGLTGQDLAASLQVLRLAILFMEEVFFSVGLEAHASHPVNLGWLNYFARWAYAPLFRMWWPLLKSMYHARFTKFLEKRFDLPHLQSSMPGVEEVIGSAESVGRDGGRGFARECWERSFKDAEELEKRTQGKRTYQYRLTMRYEGREAPYDIQAALLLFREVGRAAVWEADDFFVPPGLWGVGLGEDFLKKLPEALRVSMLVVRLPVAAEGAPGQRRERATDAHLYRCAGFRQAWYDEGTGGLKDPVTGLSLGVDVGDLDGGASPEKGGWLFRMSAPAREIPLQ